MAKSAKVVAFLEVLFILSRKMLLKIVTLYRYLAYGPRKSRM